jgi:hypothetical protein
MIPTTTEPHRARHDYDTSSGRRWGGGKDPSVRQAIVGLGCRISKRVAQYRQMRWAGAPIMRNDGAFLPQDLLVDPD